MRHRDLLIDKVELIIKIPFNKQVQLQKIVEGHKTVKGWLIQMLEISPDGRTVIQAERINDDYRKFLHNCRIEDLRIKP